MGTLFEISRQAVIPLRARSLVGRSADAGVPLPSDWPWASREHALLAWNGEGWELRDVGSHNGTFVNGERLSPGTRVLLTEGAEISFGRRESTHRLADASAPQPLAITPEGACVAGSGGLVELVGDNGVVGMVLRVASDRWVLETDGAMRTVRDNEEVTLGGSSWRLVLPVSNVVTVTRVVQESPVRIVFRYSRDEEHVEMTLYEGGRAIDLGARAHNYLLLTLARLRTEDAKNTELARSEHGWVDAQRLERLLRVDAKNINVLVHRGRRQLAEAGLACAARLVERRDLTRQLRLGIVDIEIIPLG